MIQTFVSRPNWVPSPLEMRLVSFYQLLEDLGFQAKTIGKDHAPLRAPFSGVEQLMKTCQCTIVLGLPQIHVTSGEIKNEVISRPLMLATEWNQIEATMSLMLRLPTLVLLHKGVAGRGIFDRGAADVFVHEFDSGDDGWLTGIRSALATLKSEAVARQSPSQVV